MALNGTELVNVQTTLQQRLALTSDIAALNTVTNIGGSKTLVQIAQRCGANGQQGTPGGSTPYLTNHVRMLAPYGADALQIIYPNFYLNAGNGEFNLLPSMFTANGVTYSGGSTYAVGDVDTFAVTSSTGIAAVKVMITAVAAGVPSQVQVVDGGLYNTPLASGVSPASTTGSGTGATATFTWTAGHMGMHIGIEPVWNTLVANGPNSVESGSQGFVPTAGNPGNFKNRSLLAPMGNFLVTDLMSVDIPVGGVFGLRCSFGYSTPQLGRLPISSTNAPNAPVANREAATAASTFTDFSTSGTIGTTVNSAIIQPVAILGIPKVYGPTIFAVGDSRLYGVATASSGSISGYDPMDNDGNLGWFEKALSAKLGIAYMPFSNMARQSDTLTRMIYTVDVGGRGRLAAIALARPTAVYMGLNFNDFTGSNLSTILSYEQQIVGELRGMGVKYVFTDTTDPNTTSTDNWATPDNQTLTSKSADISSRNSMLRTGSWAPYDFFIDQAPNSEHRQVGSGLWRANGTALFYTGDGTHAGANLITLKAITASQVIAANVKL